MKVIALSSVKKLGNKIKSFIIILSFISLQISAEIARFDYDQRFSNLNVNKFEEKYVVDGHLSSDDLINAIGLDGYLGEFYKTIAECKSVDESFMIKVNDFSLKGLRIATMTLVSFFGVLNDSENLDIVIDRLAGHKGYSAHDDNILNYELGMRFLINKNFDTAYWYFSKLNDEYRAIAFYNSYAVHKDYDLILGDYYLKEAARLGSVNASIDVINNGNGKLSDEEEIFLYSSYKDSNFSRAGEVYLNKYRLNLVGYSEKIGDVLNELALLKNKLALYLITKENFYNILSRSDFYRAEIWVIIYHFYIGDDDSKYFFDLLYDGYDEAMGGLAARKEIIMNNLSTFPVGEPKNCFGEPVPIDLSAVRSWIDKTTRILESKSENLD